MPGVSALSPTAIATFVTAFGTFGLILTKIEMKRSTARCRLVAAAFVVVAFNKVFRAMQSSSEGRVVNLFGTRAEVITLIGASGVGEIACVQGGTRYTATARLLNEREIPCGAKVRIVRVGGSQFYVTKE